MDFTSTKKFLRENFQSITFSWKDPFSLIGVTLGLLYIAKDFV
jgi:hypothetical protein